MTTIAESICLMDWLREHREIGLECMTDDDIYDHHPEYCDRETRDYEEWEQGLRSSSPVAERAKTSSSGHVLSCHPNSRWCRS